MADKISITPHQAIGVIIWHPAVQKNGLPSLTAIEGCNTYQSHPLLIYGENVNDLFPWLLSALSVKVDLKYFLNKKMIGRTYHSF